MMDDEKKFYFQGKWFETSKEMLSYENEWKKLPLDQESAERILERVKKDILMNVFLREIKYDNGGFSKYVEKIFDFSMRNLRMNDGMD